MTHGKSVRARWARVVLGLSVVLLLTGCGKKEEVKRAAPATLITVAQAQTREIEVLEETVGTVESVVDPRIAAEVEGRLLQVLAEPGQEVVAGELLAVIDARDLQLAREATLAEINRLQALLANQRRVVERNRRLLEARFIAPSVLDESTAQQAALEAQIEGARARLAQVERNIGKTRVVAPFAGQVESRAAVAGAYVRIGDPLFRLVARHGLRARLPFPESAAPRLSVGQTVRLTTPTAPQHPVTGRIEDLKPMVGVGNRAVEAIVRLEQAPGWRPGASVNAAVVVGRRSGAVVVPETSVVLRPAGTVVYVIENNRALQRVVQTGIARDGWVEIVSGVSAGETVAVDGAGFLTDQAAVTVREGRE